MTALEASAAHPFQNYTRPFLFLFIFGAACVIFFSNSSASQLPPLSASEHTLSQYGYDKTSLAPAQFADASSAALIAAANARVALAESARDVAAAERSAALSELSALRASLNAAPSASPTNAPRPLPMPCVRRTRLAFVIAGFLKGPSAVLALHLSSVKSFYGDDAAVWLVNNGGPESGRFLAAQLADAGFTDARRAGVIQNEDAAEHGYEWGALRAATHALNWTAACVPYEHVFVLQGNVALISKLPEPFGDFKRVMHFYETWDNIFMRDWVSHALGAIGIDLEPKSGAPGDVPVTPFCLPTFGPNWVMSGSCLESWIRAHALEKVRANLKAKQCALERLTASVAHHLCGVPCFDTTASFDGDINTYPNRFAANTADPSNLNGRFWLKSWGTSNGGQPPTSNPCNSDKPYPGHWGGGGP